jgi:large subunit ribosomal protein L27
MNIKRILYARLVLTQPSQGRDHTIHAAQPGYVRYYRDPARHPKRKYIGIVFDKSQQLPAPANSVTRRKLGRIAYEMPETYAEQETGDLITGPETGLPGNAEMGAAQPSTIRDVPNEQRGIKTIKKTGTGEVVTPKLTLRPGYQYRLANWEIGRAAERSAAAQAVKPFVPGDRFTAWRKRNVRVAKNAERRSMGRGGKKASKK